MDGLNKMTLYAVNAATASNKTNYSLITGNTCVGYVVDTMDEADLWPKWMHLTWYDGTAMGNVVSIIPTAIKLPVVYDPFIPAFGYGPLP